MAKRVLICDDDQDLLDVSHIILSKNNFEIETLKECKKNDLIKFIKEVNPDIILMDLRIPEVGGKQATMQIKSNNSTRDIPVILFSADHDIQKIAQETGADDFLQKPFDINKMVELIRKYI